MRALVSGFCLVVAGCAHAGEPTSDAQPVGADCSYDFSEMMRLDFEAFDQDIEGGWRILGSTPGCEAETADLIQKYRTMRVESQRLSLMHHEMQLRGAAGQYETAADLAREVLEFDLPPVMQAYHEAELAFFARDYDALLAARRSLAAVPMPEHFEKSAAQYLEKYPDQPPLVWPVNLDVVDGLIACFDKPYSEAYSFSCRPESEEKVGAE
jgi:hypothetical protein